MTSQGMVLAVIGFALAVVCILQRERFATPVMIMAIASFAVDPYHLKFVEQVGGFTISSLFRALLFFAILLQVLTYGVRAIINWPILALVAIAILNLTVSESPHRLSAVNIVKVAIQLGTPWLFLSVILNKDERHLYSLAVACLPLLSLTIGLIWSLSGLAPLLTSEHWESGTPRLIAGAGNAGALAQMCYVAVAVALHESVRTRHWWFYALIFANASILILTGARMGLLATVAFVVSYAFISPVLREIVGRRNLVIVAGTAITFGVFGFYFQYLSQRTFDNLDVAVNTSMRDVVIPYYFNEWLSYPVFGRGIGSWAPLGQDRFPENPLAWVPHNDYVKALLSGGAVGFVLLGLALCVTFRTLWSYLRGDDRVFILAAGISTAIYMMADNVYGDYTGLGLFAYIGVLLTRQKYRRESRRPDRRVSSDRQRSRPDFASHSGSDGRRAISSGIAGGRRRARKGISTR